MFTKITDWKLYLEGKNGTTEGEHRKDVMRIEDIIAKADGDRKKEEQLAQLMANKITDMDKAERRGNVAEGENYHNIAAIFFKRYRELKKASKKKNEDIDNGASVKKITAKDINPKDDNASTHEVPLAVKLHGKNLKKESLVGNDYSTKNANRDDLQSLMNLLDANDISYSFDGAAETIDFDPTELSMDEQDQVLKFLNIEFL